ncbi:MAG TPA: methylated-DNA--[protein]-cysteine S-methyltransferase [Clostridiales bacterium]|nr:methylated-DNA--[protein]-cysteine S-methyltransferase [Clostridiales bacterium]HPP36368.1 methylated-DNA--[protein]-cysteine S-methyltransferase [Clostridiales bacterium]
MNSIYFYDTPVGRAAIADNGRAVIQLKFIREGWISGDRLGRSETGAADVWPAGSCGTPFIICETPLIKEAARQLYEYLDGNRKVFDIPLELEGTPFQKAVWQALLEIPYGETRSYGEIAERIGNPKAARAVGMANNRNHVAVFVPCHRVIGADGRLVGYASGIDIKKKLLDLEKLYTTKKPSL